MTNLIGLRAENFKRLEIVNLEFPPGGGAYAIMGANEAGKSSAIDALETVIAGRKGAALKTARPIHDGADSSRVVATFDDIVVTRVFKANGSTGITVTGADGRKIQGTEALDRLYSHVALDPLAFSRLTDADQVQTLLPMIGFDPKPLDAAHDEAYALRTINNRDRDQIKARLNAAPDPVGGLPAEEISVADLSAKLETGVAHNTARNEASIRLDSRLAELAGAKAVVAAAEEALAKAIMVADTAGERAADAKVAFEALAPDVDVAPFREQIANAETTNGNIRAKIAREALVAEFKSATAETDKLTKVIDKTKADKAAALAAAKMPVPGLTIDPETMTLLLDGIPFSQASTGVKIKIGTAIAMALAPDLKLIVIRDASLLDQGNRDIIDQLAKANKFLVIMEIADESQPVGAILVDGNVAEVRS